MAPGVQVLLSGALTFGVPLLLAASELLRRPSAPEEGWDRPGPDAPRPAPGPAGGQSRAPALPACLLLAAQGLPPARAEPKRLRELV